MACGFFLANKSPQSDATSPSADGANVQKTTRTQLDHDHELSDNTPLILHTTPPESPGAAAVAAAAAAALAITTKGGDEERKRRTTAALCWQFKEPVDITPSAKQTASTPTSPSSTAAGTNFNTHPNHTHMSMGRKFLCCVAIEAPYETIASPISTTINAATASITNSTTASSGRQTPDKDRTITKSLSRQNISLPTKLDNATITTNTNNLTNLSVTRPIRMMMYAIGGRCVTNDKILSTVEAMDLRTGCWTTAWKLDRAEYEALDKLYNHSTQQTQNSTNANTHTNKPLSAAAAAAAAAMQEENKSSAVNEHSISNNNVNNNNSQVSRKRSNSGPSKPMMSTNGGIVSGPNTTTKKNGTANNNNNNSGNNNNNATSPNNNTNATNNNNNMTNGSGTNVNATASASGANAIGVLVSGGSVGSGISLLPSSSRRNQIASLNVARCEFGAVVIGQYIYVSGGIGLGNERYKSVERYDSQTNVWTILKKGMSSVRAQHACCVLDGKMYMIGGNDWFPGRPVLLDAHYLRTAECYDPSTDEFQTIASMHIGRFAASCCVLNGYIYVTGGDSGERALNVVERYDPKKNTWHILAPMLTERHYHLTVACPAMLPSPLASTPATIGEPDGKIYVFGGSGHTEPTYSSVEEYDTITNTWLDVGQSNTARFAHASVLASLPAAHADITNSPGGPRENILYIVGDGEKQSKCADECERYMAVSLDY